MNEVRKVQRAGQSTLLVSIPSDYAKHLGLHEGDNVTVREEEDGTLRMIPTVRKSKTTKASIRSDLVENDELLSKLIISCYMLGYDSIELASKNRMRPSRLTHASKTMRDLRGLEIVESSDSRLLAQSFMDPTKFPVDSLIKRLQLLVSRSLRSSIESLRGGSPGILNEIRRIQEEIDELYWLIVRQLLVALSNREISGKIGLESPLHTSGDRVSAKTIDEIGRIILELTEEITGFKEAGMQVEGSVLDSIEGLANRARDSFDVTMESLLTPDHRTIEKAMETIEDTLQVEKKVMLELSEFGNLKVRRIVSSYGQLARYCSIIIEIALNRLLRKTSRICVITSE
jgi:phosphate uptake regulator